MPSEPLSLPVGCMTSSDGMYMWTIDAGKHGFKVAEVLRPDALLALRYPMYPPALVIINGTDGWILARFASVTELGRMVFEPMLQLAPPATEDDLQKYGRGRRAAA